MNIRQQNREASIKSAQRAQEFPLTAYNCNNSSLKTAAEMARAGTIGRHERLISDQPLPLHLDLGHSSWHPRM
jgi:hypothetical protein